MEEVPNWYKDKTIYQKLDSMNTEEVKAYCEENGLKLSGPKYALRDRLIAHCELASFRAENNLPTAPDGHDSDHNEENETISDRVIKDFATNKMSWGDARDMYYEYIKEAKTFSSPERRVEMTLAATRGMDYHLYKAITGPDCKMYNGSRGEIGLELHYEICAELAGLYHTCRDDNLLSDELLQQLLNFCKKENSSKCKPYGFDRYDSQIRPS